MNYTQKLKTWFRPILTDSIYQTKVFFIVQYTQNWSERDKSPKNPLLRFLTKIGRDLTKISSKNLLEHPLMSNSTYFFIFDHFDPSTGVVPGYISVCHFCRSESFGHLCEKCTSSGDTCAPAEKYQGPYGTHS